MNYSIRKCELGESIFRDYLPYKVAPILSDVSISAKIYSRSLKNVVLKILRAPKDGKFQISVIFVNTRKMEFFIQGDSFFVSNMII